MTSVKSGRAMRITDENRSDQRLRFFEELLALRPTSVVDVGCGDGHLLHLCAELELSAQGVEADAGRVASLRASGLDVLAASAEALPFASDSFDWACLRHVAHHLVDPAVAVAELARVARRGVLMAEPWRDLDLPAHATAAAIDAWMKRQDRRLGRVHGDDVSPSRLVAWLPDSQAWDVSYAAFIGSRRIPLEEVEAEAEPRLAGLGRRAPEREELGGLFERAAQTGVAATGTATVVAIRRDAPTID